MRRFRTNQEALRARCDTAARMLAMYAAAHDAAIARVLAAPDDVEARERHDDAEQLHYLAGYELRRARRALRRREALDAFIARWMPASGPLWPRRR